MCGQGAHLARMPPKPLKNHNRPSAHLAPLYPAIVPSLPAPPPLLRHTTPEHETRQRGDGGRTAPAKPVRWRRKRTMLGAPVAGRRHAGVRAGATDLHGNARRAVDPVRPCCDPSAIGEAKRRQDRHAKPALSCAAYHHAGSLSGASGSIRAGSFFPTPNPLLSQDRRARPARRAARHATAACPNGSWETRAS